MIVFCNIYFVNMFWFNIKISKKSYRWQFFLLSCKTLVFLVLSFLSLVTKIRCPKNRYTDLKSALDQPLISSNILFRIYIIISPEKLIFSLYIPN